MMPLKAVCFKWGFARLGTQTTTPLCGLGDIKMCQLSLVSRLHKVTTCQTLGTINCYYYQLGNKSLLLERKNEMWMKKKVLICSKSPSGFWQAVSTISLNSNNKKTCKRRLTWVIKTSTAEKAVRVKYLSRSKRTTGPRGESLGTPIKADNPIKKMFPNHSVRWGQLLWTDPIIALNE